MTSDVCKCSHAKARHELSGFDGECVADACRCRAFRPQAGPVPAAPTPPTVKALVQAIDATPPKAAPAVSVDELLAKAKQSDLKPIVRLAERIEALAEDLRARVTEEDAAEAVKAHIAKLTKQLADAKAKLQRVGRGKGKPAAEPGGVSCPDCPKTFGSAQGLSMHRFRAHGYRKAS